MSRHILVGWFAGFHTKRDVHAVSKIPSKRENLVVSNREMRQLFDSMKEMGEIMRRQNAKLESVAAKLEDNSKEVNELKEQLKTVLERGSQTAEREYIHCGPVPKELKVCANFNFH